MPITKATAARHRNELGIPTMSQMIIESAVSRAKIKRSTKTALVEWLAQSERLVIARDHYQLTGEQFVDFAGRLGVDRASAYRLVKLWPHRAAILKRCKDEGRWPGWEVCLYWYMRDPRRTWHRASLTASTDEYATPPAVYQRFGTKCTLDVCATPGKTMCDAFYTKEQDGLRRKWHGIVWVNPPYSEHWSLVRQSGRVRAGRWHDNRIAPRVVRCPVVSFPCAVWTNHFHSRKTQFRWSPWLRLVSQHDRGVEPQDGATESWRSVACDVG